MSDQVRIRVGISAEQAVSVGIDPAFYRGDPAIPHLHIGTVEAAQDAAEMGVTVTGEYPDYYLNFLLPRGSVGPTPVIRIGSVTSGEAASATITGTAEEPVLDLTLPIAPGPQLSIGEVTEGQDFSATLTGTAEEPVLNLQLVRGPQGRGVASFGRTAGNGAAGTKDTYTITYTDGSSDTFTVYNGVDGLGAGDMVAQVYDEDGDGIVERADVAGALETTATIAMGQVQGLEDALAGIAFEETDPTVPAWAKQPAKPTYTADEVGAKKANWTPAIADVTGLEAAQAGKAEADHVHDGDTILNLDEQLAGKADAKHSHQTADVEGQDAAQAGKAALAHAHTTAEVTGLDAALGLKADTGHGHEVADVTGLTQALEGKADAAHTHDGCLTEETDPTVPAWAKASAKPTYTADEVGAEAAGAVAAHAQATDAHAELFAAVVPLSGGTMTGLLTLSGAPTASLHAATKQYVDDALGDQETLQAAL